MKAVGYVCFAIVLTAAATTWAQDDSNAAASPRRGFSIVDGLDDFGRAIFGGSRPEARRSAPNTSTRGATPRNDDSRTAAPADSSRARAAAAIAAQKNGATNFAPPSVSLPSPTAAGPATTRSYAPTVPPYAEPYMSVEERTPHLADASSASVASDSVVSATVDSQSGAEPATTGDQAAGATPWSERPLYQRMNVLRRSTFAGEATPPTSPATEPAAHLVDAPRVAQRTSPAASADVAPAPPAAVASSADVSPSQVGSAGPSPQEDLLITRQGPALSVETLGPRRITVGRESSYQLIVSNAGAVAADEVVVFVNLPAWAEVLGAEASIGSTQPSAAGEAARPLVWKVGQLAAGSREQLTLHIVPRESKPFDLGVRWDYRPVASLAAIEVEEPKLAMQLDGPREVAYGKQEVFTLKLANNGSGDAEDIVLTLLPVGTGDNRPVAQHLGTLTAGQQRSIEVELTARQAGDLVIQVAAQGANGVRADLAETILVRRAALQASVEGPPIQFVGQPTTYRVLVANTGDAPANHLRFSLGLPPGAKYLGGIEAATAEAGGTRVAWTVDKLGIGESREFLLQCSLGLPGVSRIDVACAADDDLAATAAATTQVDAVADLTLEVKDPAGPIPVEQQTTYEMRIVNRGSKAAEGVEVLAFFSNGIEPVSVEGGLHRIQPGQVVFNPIATIAPGGEVALTIRAKAQTPGMHIYRCEVHCKPLGIRRVSEVTTQFYANTMVAAQPATTTYSPANGATASAGLPIGSQPTTGAPHVADGRGYLAPRNDAAPVYQPTPSPARGTPLPAYAAPLTR